MNEQQTIDAVTAALTGDLTGMRMVYENVTYKVIERGANEVGPGDWRRQWWCVHPVQWRGQFLPAKHFSVFTADEVLRYRVP